MRIVLCVSDRVRGTFLEGKLVGVLENLGECVIAKSTGMQLDGGKTGVPICDALPKCPQGIYV